MNIYDLTPEQQVAVAISHAHEGLRKAAEMREYEIREKRASNELIPGIVDSLIDSEFITKEKRAEAAQRLSNPVNCLKLLKKFAEVAIPRDRAEIHAVGTPIKEASYVSVSGTNGAQSNAQAIWDNL